jgi:hypothetical protein
LSTVPPVPFVRFAVEHGMTVFVVSWRNPDASCGHFGWDDYVEHGAMRAIEIAQSISGADKLPLSSPTFAIAGATQLRLSPPTRSRNSGPHWPTNDRGAKSHGNDQHGLALHR